MDKNSISSKRVRNSQSDNEDNDDASSMKKNKDVLNESDIYNSIIPIKDLKPQLDNWTIRGKCYAKTGIHPFYKGKQGTVFSFEIRDSSGNIRVSAFNKECARFFNLIQENLTVIISKGRIVERKVNYNLTKHNYEIIEEGGPLGKAPSRDPSAGLTCGKCLRPNSAFSLGQSMTPCPTPETSTSGSSRRRAVISVAHPTPACST